MKSVKNAEALQVYYTSCRRGLSGYAGFQTRAESAGILPDERREIESKAMYQPPRDLPREPDAETIAACFPKAFRTVNLTSGRIALIRAVYGGQDYSGRWGNYFAHTLVLEDLIDGSWPIDVYAWTGWVSGLADDESEPTALPAIRVDEICAGTDFSFDELGTFLREEQGRTETLAKMLNAVFRRKADSRSLVIRERLELAGLYWVACIQKAFPAQSQRQLTCSTFQFDPRSSLAVNVTVGETDFLFDDGERKYQFYVFDFVTDEHSDVPDAGYEYARVIAKWMASEPRRVEAFHVFASLFEQLEIGPDLLNVVRLYQLEAGEDIALAPSDLQLILGIVRAHARPAALSRLLSAVGGLTRALDPKGPPEEWAAVVRFLTDGAVSTGEAEHRLRACRCWVEAFDNFVVERQRGEDAVLALRSEIERAFVCDPSILAEEFLSDLHIDWVLKHSTPLQARGLGIVMNEIDRSCRQAGRDPSYKSTQAQGLIEAVLDRKPGQPPELQWAFAPYRSDLDGLAATTEFIATLIAAQMHDRSLGPEEWHLACRAVGRSLGSVLATAEPSVRFRLLNILKANDRNTFILVGEWEASIERAADKLEAHWSYEQNVLSDDSKFAKDMASRMAVALIKMLPPDTARKQARSWVESGRCRQLPDDLARSILSMASRDVRFSPEDRTSERLAAQIVAEMAGRRFTLDSNRLQLREAASRALSEPDGTSGLRSVLTSADVDSYGEFVRAVIPGLLSRATTPGAHRRVFLALVVDAHLDAFAESYCRLLGQRPRDRFDDVDLAALVFWLRFAEADSAWPLLGRFREQALDAIATHIASMSGRRRTTIERAVEKQLDPKGPAARRELDSFLGRMSARQSSWLGRLLGRGKTGP
jgi:hypothetical protein